MSGDVERFVARFERFGAAPSVGRYLALFYPDATLFDSGMERPLVVAEIPAHIEGILRLVPDFRMTPQRFRFRAPTLFVEARNRATLAGAPIEWPSIYCIDLKGDHVFRGRRYYDRRPLFARLSAEIAERPRCAADPSPIGSALPATPLLGVALRRRMPDVALRLLAEAGDDALVFREWQACGTLGGSAVRIGVADRIDLAGGSVTSARSYFDTLALA
jgi:hypothetical protein